jgi:hypothetical protein
MENKNMRKFARKLFKDSTFMDEEQRMILGNPENPLTEEEIVDLIKAFLTLRDMEALNKREAKHIDKAMMEIARSIVWGLDEMDVPSLLPPQEIFETIMKIENTDFMARQCASAILQIIYSVDTWSPDNWGLICFEEKVIKTVKTN